MNLNLCSFSSEFEFPAFGCFSLIKECAIECIKKIFLETFCRNIEFVFKRFNTPIDSRLVKHISIRSLVQGLVKGQSSLSPYKRVLLLIGTARAVYYFYQSWAKGKTTLIEDAQLAFLKVHEAELEEMYETKMPVGKWEHLGTGVSKIAFTHEDFPEILIKIPKGNVGFRGFSGEDDLKIHYANLVELKKLATSFDRIALPKSTLYKTSKGSILVEQKFRMSEYVTVPNDADKQDAISQFNKFILKSNLCDIWLYNNHNGGILADKTPITIGIIDFDCILNSESLISAEVHSL